MTVPSAPVEAGGDKILFMVYGSAGTNYAAVYRGIEPITVNGDVLASMAVGTHGDGRDFTANDAIVVVGGVGLGSSTVRKLLTDSTGRLITRPPGAFNAGGGANDFGHPYIVGRATINGEQVGWLGVATHQDGVAGFTSPQGIVVVGGYDGANVRKALTDTSGRLRMYEDYTFAGNGHVAVVTPGTAVELKSSTVCRKVIVRADPGNLAAAYIGGSGVTADGAATTGGLQLAPGAGESLTISNTNLVWVNSTSAVGVSFIWFT